MKIEITHPIRFFFLWPLLLILLPIASLLDSIEYAKIKKKIKEEGDRESTGKVESWEIYDNEEGRVVAHAGESTESPRMLYGGAWHWDIERFSFRVAK